MSMTRDEAYERMDALEERLSAPLRAVEAAALQKDLLELQGDLAATCATCGTVGSGVEQLDGHGIYLGMYCDPCWDAGEHPYRSDIMDKYTTDEPIEPDEEVTLDITPLLDKDVHALAAMFLDRDVHALAASGDTVRVPEDQGQLILVIRFADGGERVHGIKDEAEGDALAKAAYDYAERGGPAVRQIFSATRNG